MVFEGKWRCRAPSTKLIPLFNHAYVFTDECKHGVNVFAGLQAGSIKANAQRGDGQTAGTATARN